MSRTREPLNTPLMKLLVLLSLLVVPGVAMASIHRKPGSATPLPHDKYIRVVSEADSPVQQIYVKSKDGLYVAAALRKPRGDGPFPAIVMFHGAPGGRGMEQLVGWSRGATGGPAWERFLQEGFVVIVADYRGGNMQGTSVPSTGPEATAIDDGLAVVAHVRALPFVDATRVHVYGVSLGGNLAMHLVSKDPGIRSAILGAPAPMWFLGMQLPPNAPRTAEAIAALKSDPEVTRRNIEPVRAPVLIQVGTADRLLGICTTLHDALAAAGKDVRMEIYEHGYHDFVLGPQGHNRPDLPQGEALLDSTLAALDQAVRFVKGQPLDSARSQEQ